MSKWAKCCPFCGSNDILIVASRENETDQFFACCDDCLAQGPLTDHSDTAKEDWNTRPADAPSGPEGMMVIDDVISDLTPEQASKYMEFVAEKLKVAYEAGYKTGIWTAVNGGVNDPSR